MSVNSNSGANTERATLALGCFWGSEVRFACVNGVLRTRVGYTGGTTANPTYRNLSDHIEAVDIEFDPSITSFRELLDIFWRGHEPTYKPYKRQYISAIFYNSEQQKSTAEESVTDAQKLFSKPITTEILASGVFYNAEDYHQKYFLRKRRSILKSLNLSDKQLISSSVATRLNGYSSGFGTIEQFNEEVKSFGISPTDTESIRDQIESGPNLGEC